MSDTAAAPTSEFLNRILCERRTVHDFAARSVPQALIDSALETVRWAPNHHRTEPWHIYLLGPVAQQAIAELNSKKVLESRGERAAEIKLARWLAMPGWLVMTCDRSDDELREREDYAACCCAAQNFMLSLWGNGVGVKWTTGEVVRSTAFSEVVGFNSATESVVGLFWYGWPVQVNEQHRRPLADFLKFVD
jgi:nitroreductase